MTKTTKEKEPRDLNPSFPLPHPPSQGGSWWKQVINTHPRPPFVPRFTIEVSPWLCPLTNTQGGRLSTVGTHFTDEETRPPTGAGEERGAHATFSCQVRCSFSCAFLD